MTEQKTIPEFNTIQEEAEFWDTHDLTDYWRDAKPLYLHRKARYTQTLPIRFDSTDLMAVRKQAEDIGVGTGTLIRMWVKERLLAGNTRVTKAA